MLSSDSEELESEEREMDSAWDAGAGAGAPYW